MHDDAAMVRLYRDFPDSTSIQIAFDFTEVFSYCFPFTNKNIAYDSDPNSVRDIALNELFGEWLFFRDITPILLPSYKVELSTLHRCINNSELNEIAIGISALESDPDLFHKLELALKTASASAGAAGNLSSLSSLKPLYDIAPSLMLLMDEDLRPRRRLQEFLDAAKFTNSASPESGLTAADGAAPNHAVTKNWWVDALHEGRPYNSLSSNIIDATAIADLQQINATIPGQGPSILVSRSTTMRRILRQNNNNIACKYVYILHPRILGSFMVSEGSKRPLKQMIRERYSISREIMEHYFDDIDLEMRYGHYRIHQLIKRIQSLWNEIDNIAITQAALFDSRRLNQFKKSNDNSLRQLEVFIQSNSHIRDILADRARQVILNIKLGNSRVATFGVLTENDNKGHDKLVIKEKNTVQAASQMEPLYTANSSNDGLLYNMQFYSAKLSEITKDKSDNSKEVLLSAIQDSLNLDEYEKLIAIGYTLCIYLEWEIALQYFDVASQSNTPIPKHESYYFLCLSRRHSSTEFDSSLFEDCLSLISKASEIKKGLMGETYWDPRYLNEAGVLLANAEKRGIEFSSSQFPWSGALEVWREALLITDSDKLVRALILNNIVYYALLDNGSDRNEALSEYGALSELTEEEPELASVPVIEHTLVMASHAFSDVSPQQTVKDIEALERILSTSNIPDYVRQSIEADVVTLRSKVK